LRTAPVNPPDGVTVMVEVLPGGWPGLKVMLALLVRANSAGAATLTVTVVDCVNEPEMR